ncbi:alpha/beta fold hydrolase [Microtetraspora fusca]|uniref:alpha/beta fold hydrolase n=1 Tax=Microtetraspora fusca TaxID=1997 RepID=UPI00083712ED|nr:alpha/beta hydrolase [Microtetraspora fusca]
MNNSPINPKTITVDGLTVRYAESEQRDTHALLLSPWPESVYAFEPTWAELAADVHIVAVDLPGFGQSQGRPDVLTPRTAGAFVHRILDALGLDQVHIVGPDIGTSASLFAAAQQPGRFHSVVIGSGGASADLELGEPLAGWVSDPDITWYEQNAHTVMKATLDNIFPAVPLADHVREDYLASYAGRRFAESMRYVRTYPTELRALEQVLPDIRTPVRIIAPERDQVVPPAHGEFLAARLPNSSLDIVDAGHFIWEEAPKPYASLVLDWWDRHHTNTER